MRQGPDGNIYASIDRLLFRIFLDRKSSYKIQTVLTSKNSIRDFLFVPGGSSITPDPILITAEEAAGVRAYSLGKATVLFEQRLPYRFGKHTALRSAPWTNRVSRKYSAEKDLFKSGPFVLPPEDLPTQSLREDQEPADAEDYVIAARRDLIGTKEYREAQDRIDEVTSRHISLQIEKAMSLAAISKNQLLVGGDNGIYLLELGQNLERRITPFGQGVLLDSTVTEVLRLRDGSVLADSCNALYRLLPKFAIPLGLPFETLDSISWSRVFSNFRWHNGVLRSNSPSIRVHKIIAAPVMNESLIRPDSVLLIGDSSLYLSRDSGKSFKQILCGNCSNTPPFQELRNGADNAFWITDQRILVVKRTAEGSYKSAFLDL